jgi:hypothetical protein
MSLVQRLVTAVIFSPVFLFAHPVLSDQVINDDLIVTGKSCVGTDCVDGEGFAFLGLKVKSDAPEILFDDTSGSSFPANNWTIGITDNAMAGGASFFIRDATAGADVLLLVPGASGGIALGSGSAVESDAVSVGDEGAERRIMHVADGVDDTDALNKAQVDTKFSELSAPIEERIDALEAKNSELSDAIADRMDDIDSRIDGLIDRVNQL